MKHKVPMHALLRFYYPHQRWMRMMLVAVSVATMVSCQSLPPRSPSVEAFHDTIPWRRDQVVGLEATLIDPHKVQYLCFGKDGSLPMTFGTPGGKVCGPLYGWKLKRGRLFITDAEGRNLGSEIYLVSLTDDILMIRWANGDLAKYKVHRRHA